MKVLKHTLQPTTPVQGIAAMPFTFDTPGYRALVEGWRRTGRTKRFGAQRMSRGFILNGLAYYWCPKGYYRCGKGDRRPIQHILWEKRHRRKIPHGFEIWFKDRDRHNFSPENLELLPKSEVHARLFHSGEVPKVTSETSLRAWDTRRARLAVISRQQTALLLRRFENQDHEHPNHELKQQMVAARDESRRAAIRTSARAGYARRKAGIHRRPARRAAPLAD